MAIDKRLLQQVKQAMHSLKNAETYTQYLGAKPGAHPGPEGHSVPETYYRSMNDTFKAMPDAALAATVQGAVGNPLANIANHISNIGRLGNAARATNQAYKGQLMQSGPQLQPKPNLVKPEVKPPEPLGPSGKPLL